MGKQPMSPAGSEGPRGFTLLELLVVMAILALSAAALGPRLPGTLERVRIQAAAFALKDALEQARREAVRGNAPLLFVIVADTGDYGLDPDRLAQLPADLRLQVVTAAEAAPQVRPEAGGILFFPDGSSSGGQLVLESNRLNQVMRIDWRSGRITLATVER